jgi:hypothetical protein
MNTTRITGRLVSCWSQPNGVYHLAISDENGNGGVIAMSQFEVIAALGGKSACPDLSITCKAPSET